MALNQVQQDKVQELIRPQLDIMIRAKRDLENFVTDFDAFQLTSDALPTDATVLDDAGAAPREDAPTLVGTDIQNIRNFSENMAAVIGTTAEQVLIGKMKRTLSSVLR